MNPYIVHMVQQSWAKVLPIAPQAAALLYNKLFGLDGNQIGQGVIS